MMHAIKVFVPIFSQKCLVLSQKEYCDDIGANGLLHKTKEDILMHRWRFPSLSIHGKLFAILQSFSLVA